MLGFVLFSFLIFATSLANASCYDGWVLFPRLQGLWCIKVLNSTAGWSFDAALQKCYQHSSTLSGIQTSWEFRLLANTLRTHMEDQKWIGMWIGAKRSNLCNAKNCILKKNSFYWYDGHTTGTEGFIWQSINPSGNGPCGRLLIDPWGPQIDDVPCDWTQAATLLVCGKVPSNDVDENVVGWNTLHRDDYDWSIKIFYVVGGVTFLQAGKMCKTYSAKLSGVQNLTEFDYFASLLYPYKGGQDSVAMWIGAQSNGCETQSCQVSKAMAFLWTDSFTTGNDGFVWGKGSPSGKGKCAMYLIDSQGPKFDDAPCDAKTTQFVCGRQLE